MEQNNLNVPPKMEQNNLNVPPKMEQNNLKASTTINYNIVNTGSEDPLIPLDPSLRAKRFWRGAKFVTYYIIGIMLIVFGASYVNDCPVQKMIPLCWILLGLCFVLERLANVVYDYRSSWIRGEEAEVPQYIHYINIFFLTARFATFIAECYLVFHRLSNSKPDDEDDCNGSFFTNSMWQCIAGIVFTVMLYILFPAIITPKQL